MHVLDKVGKSRRARPTGCRCANIPAEAHELRPLPAGREHAIAQPEPRKMRNSTVTLSGFAVFADRSDMGLGSTPQFAIDKSPVCGRRTS